MNHVMFTLCRHFYLIRVIVDNSLATGLSTLGRGHFGRDTKYSSMEECGVFNIQANTELQCLATH